MIRVVFVCLGNICRSPMAEAVFRNLVEEAGLTDQFEIDSAGTGDWHLGEPAHPGTRKILSKHGIELDHRARRVSPEDLSADYFIVMDRQNLRDVAALGDARIRLMMEFAPDHGVDNV